MKAATETAGELQPVVLDAGKMQEKFILLQDFYATIFPELRRNLVRKSIAVWFCIFLFLLPALILIVTLVHYPQFTATTSYSALLVVMVFASPLWCIGIVFLYGILMRGIQKANKVPHAGPELVKLLDAFSEEYFGYPQSGFYHSLVCNGNKETNEAEKFLASLSFPIRSLALYSPDFRGKGDSFQLLFLEEKIEIWEGPFPDPEIAAKKEYHHLTKL